MSLLTVLQNPAASTSGGGSISDNISLYLLSTAPYNGNTTLYINGVFKDNNATSLYINGDFVNNNATLYTAGIMVDNRSLNLSCIGTPLPSAYNNNATLYINGKSVLDITNSISLYTESNKWYSTLNLMLAGVGTQSPVANNSTLNLFVKGAVTELANNISLYLYNKEPFANVPLFIKGLGTTIGALPFNSSLNLFINRNASEVISLFIKSEPKPTNVIDFFVSGVYALSQNTTLVVPKTHGKTINPTNLYIHGY